MPSIAEIIETVLEGIAEDMIRDQNAKNMRASGASANSFQIIADELSGELRGANHWYFQIHGRKPGPFRNGIETMMEWIKRKGIKPRDDKTTIKQLAFLFARKIRNEGTDIYQGKRFGIMMPQIIDVWKTIAAEQIALKLKQNIKDGLSTKQ